MTVAQFQHKHRHRPELHRLNNRSHELWPPLVALSALFEEAILQALELLTCNEDDTVWIEACELLDILEDKMGSAQWAGHIMKRLQLTDRTRHKAYSGGQMYLIRRKQVPDMVTRYDVGAVED